MLHFKKKYFTFLKEYYEMRCRHKRNIEIADAKFFHRYVRFCFQNWAWFQNKQKSIKFANMDISRKYLTKEKQKYLNALKRAYAIEIALKNLRKRTLTKRVFISF